MEMPILIRRICSCAISLPLLFLALTGVSIQAQESDANVPDMDERAVASLTRFTKFLDQAQSFGFTVQTEHDSLQENTQMFEFGGTRTVLVDRPNRLRVEAKPRDGSQRLIIIDGENIAVADEEDKVYAIVPRSGSLRENMEYLRGELEMPLPLAELAYDDLTEIATARMESATYIGESTIGGVLCEHSAFQSAETDVQTWVAQGDKPLLQRVVITYKYEPGEPSFRAQFSEWNMTPKISDAQFTFKPPAGAEKIAFARQVLKEMTEPGESQ
jgi:hypothetical protein